MKERKNAILEVFAYKGIHKVLSLTIFFFSVWIVQCTIATVHQCLNYCFLVVSYCWLQLLNHNIFGRDIPKVLPIMCSDASQ